ncbi:MAG: alkaline phosphatase PafA [Cyclobacteriaceae bacterium]
MKSSVGKALSVGLMIMGVAPLVQAQKTTPRLVVGIVVDQMRQEYLYRYAPKFGKGGFNRLTGDGFMLTNAHYNYVPTFTGPGHASVYTGTTPAIHGIIGNDWYDKVSRTMVNCVGDERQKPVGSPNGNGDVSPWRMLSTTITDELEIATQRRAKVVGISMKDRGAVLPAGHTPDGAYWYDGGTGNFITSTYYKQGTPEWLDIFNNRKLADQYLNQEWKTLLPIDQYKESGIDDSQYEVKLKGKEKPTFPYNLKELRKQNGELDMINYVPFGDDLLTELAKTVVEAETMGKDEWTDFLSISYSTPDIIGHSMGPNSIEVEDTYLRLDKNIEDLLTTLDQRVGAGQYVVFLTADHAVADIAQGLKDWNIPGGNFKIAALETELGDFLQKYFPGKKVIEKIYNQQIFLNPELFDGDPKSSGIDFVIATELITNFLLAHDGIAQVYTRALLRQGAYDEKGVKGMIIRGYNAKRSGDIAFELEPGWVNSAGTLGTTHGSSYAYDTHVPMVFYGTGIRKGSSDLYHPITDIAPTLSVLLRIKFPNGCTGQPISELALGTTANK